MAPQPHIVRLPDGQNFSVTPVFAGLAFKSQETSGHLPMGWTIVLRTEDEEDQSQLDWKASDTPSASDTDTAAAVPSMKPKRHSHGFREPTLQNDTVFISSISIPSSAEFKAPASPTRQIAMMMYVTLYWYFHQPQPSPYLVNENSKGTPEAGRPRGEWKINVKKDGVLRGKHVLPKLERMGLIASEESSVGVEEGEEGWEDMFVSRRMFWQTPGRLFLFTLARNPGSGTAGSSYGGSPAGSRPGSPEPKTGHYRNSSRGFELEPPGSPMPGAMGSLPLNGYTSGSHLPTYFPPAACQYTMSNGIRHPLRPKPPRMGEIFYTRFVPSVGQYLSFRVASSSPNPVPYLGPVGPNPPPEASHLKTMSDIDLMKSWMAKPRVSKFWGNYTEGFLEGNLKSKNAFPVIGMWDGVPFGYFEIYWVKEDILGRHLSGDADDWERGFHVYVGEEWALGRLRYWSSALLHWCLAVDNRTQRVCLEPRVDNEKFVESLMKVGFSREKQVCFPHKQSWLVRFRRDVFEGPYL